MSLVVSFQSELEARLRKAAAAAGKDVSDLVREAVEEKLAARAPSPPSISSYQQWSDQFEAWMKDVKDRSAMYPAGYVADDSRESIYEDRD